VAQLAGFVSDRAAYHHGESSLMGAIIGMAQNFVGSNNMNLLLPNGQFGNRLEGGKNASSPRYIYTQLNSLTPLLFRNEDEYIYDYVDDDGQRVEPTTYAPIIPIILVNGTQGIGTGFSTTVPCYNPREIISNIKLMLNKKQPKTMYPWYSRFKGKITQVNQFKFESHGIYEITGMNTVHITELPVGTWTEDYKIFLETLIPDDVKHPKKGQIVKSYVENCGNHTIDIEVTLIDNCLQDLYKNDLIEKTFKLVKSINTSNMYLYNYDGKLQKYDTVEQILLEYFDSRMLTYKKRKEYILRMIKNELDLIYWKIKFLEYVIAEKIEVFKNKKAVSKATVIEKLEGFKFPKLAHSIEAAEEDKSYSYITNIQLFALTEEELEILRKKHEEKLCEYEKYENTSLQQLWLGELNEFEKAYNKWVTEMDDYFAEDDKDTKKGKKVAKGKGKGRSRK
jgi:DNA topoisomerase-2